MRSWEAMRHDRAIVDEITGPVVIDEYWTERQERRENVHTWIICYAPGHKAWMRVWLWWCRHVRRYPPPPPLDQDPVYKALFGKDADA